MVNEEGIFSKITRSRLVLRLLSNSLCYREVVAKIFSVTMASRFEIVDEEYIEELKDKSENENTRKSTEYWKNVFKKWVNERNFQANLEECESDERLLKSAYRNSVIFPSISLTSNRCATRAVSATSELNTRDINP